MRDDGAVRLFLAIAPPDGIIQEIVIFQERLTAFQGRLEEELAGRGFPGEKRPFLPHLTLARIKNLSEPGMLFREFAKTGAYGTGQFTASELCLFRSELTPRGAVYTRLGACQFAMSAKERAIG